jgi:VanZ family protein
VPNRPSYAALAAGFIAFALYGSLLPFDFHRLSLAAAWQQFHSVLVSAPPPRISRSDALANVLLFVPIGFTLAGALLADRARGWKTGLATACTVVSAAAIISISIEFLQTFGGDRVPSNVDIAAQIIGAGLGVSLWLVAGRLVTDWVRQALRARPADRPARLLTAFTLGWVFVNLAPFDITVDVGDLGSRLRSGQIALAPFSLSDFLAGRGLWDALAEMLAAIPLGMFGRLGPGRARRPVVAFGIGLLIVTAVEAAQIFIASHSASVTDILFASVGVAVGVWAGGHLVSSQRAPAADTGVNWRAACGVGIWIAILFAYHWRPFDFTVDPETIRQKLGTLSLLPFAGYRSGSYLNSLDNFMVKLALAVPLGIGYLAAVGRCRVSLSTVSAAGIMCAAAIFSVIEAGQLFLPTRVPDPTDVVVGACGVYAGIRIGAWLTTRRPS